jgi:peptide-methionine (S)-S-oxide reductase
MNKECVMIKPTLILAAMLSGLLMTASARAAETETFVFSGGCFWCTEADFEKVEGVSEVISGFTGGTTPEPKYYPGQYGDHREAAQVFYDPAKVSFEDLVRHVYRTIDYEDADGQFCDRGHSYSPAIYYKTAEEKTIAENLAPPTSVVPVEGEKEFFPVREAHQDYYKKSKFKYKFYRNNCGRDRRVEKLNG